MGEHALSRFRESQLHKKSVKVKPLLFLDFDDVICLKRTHSRRAGYDVLAGLPPDEVYKRLFHPPAVETLLEIMAEHRPRVILTTSWLRHTERAEFETIFRRTGLDTVADSLHEFWDAPAVRGRTRGRAIEDWLAAHHQGEPYVVIDDTYSGEGLPGSALDQAGRVVLCQMAEGLHRGHLAAVRKALGASSTTPNAATVAAIHASKAGEGTDVSQDDL
jgi:hypothetical protein